MDLKTALEILGFNEDATDGGKVLKMKYIQKKYHKLAMVNHPDKGGDEEYFKNITEAYILIGDYVDDEIVDNKDDCYDFKEEIARKTFKTFKFSNIKENFRSFTININNSTSTTWDKILSNHNGQPLDEKANSLHWKVKSYTDGNITANITISKWHVPKKDKQCKLLIQSNKSGNFLPAHFADNELPNFTLVVTKVLIKNQSQRHH